MASSDMLGLTTLLLILLVTVMFASWFLRRRNLPPGPWGMPLLGCLFYMGDKPYKKFHEWARRYGDVFSVKLGTELVVVLNSHQAIKDAFIKQSSKFSEKPFDSTYSRLSNNKGIFQAPWPTWKNIRKCSVGILQDLGMGKRATEERIQEESEFLVAALRELNGSPINPNHIVMNAVSNIMCNMLLGNRFQYNDASFRELLEFIRLVMAAVLSSAVLTFIPSMWHLPMPFKDRLRFRFNEIVAFMEKEVEKRRNTAQQSSNPESFIDAYLMYEKIYKTDEPKKDKSLDFLEDPEHLPITLAGLFLASTDTTGTALLWALLYLSLNQDIQERCFREIEDGIGLHNIPSLTDKSKLPYIEAVTLEVQRRASVVPLGSERTTSEDAEMHGYTIPKGTMIFTNLWAVHMDEKNWEKPEKFDPTRFLDDTGQVVNREKIIPFSIGPRDCAGSPLAKMEIFLFLTRLIQVFEFRLPDGDDTPSTEGTFGVVHAPDEFKIVAVKRVKVDDRK